MELLYAKATHLVFVVTWFAGLFYVVRLFIYHTEAQEAASPKREILSDQYRLMTRRLWVMITVPSMVLTLLTGSYLLILTQAWTYDWMWVKFTLLGGLLGYHFVCGYLVRKLADGVFPFTGFQLRLWNEGATVLLVGIVFVVVLKHSLSWLWGLAGLVFLSVALLVAIRLYRRYREQPRVTSRQPQTL